MFARLPLMALPTAILMGTGRPAVACPVGPAGSASRVVCVVARPSLPSDAYVLSVSWGGAAGGGQRLFTVDDVASFSWGTVAQEASAGRQGATRPVQPRQVFLVTVASDKTGVFAVLERGAQGGQTADLTLTTLDAHGTVRQRCVIHRALMTGWSPLVGAGTGQPLYRAVFQYEAASCGAS